MNMRRPSLGTSVVRGLEILLHPPEPAKVQLGMLGTPSKVKRARTVRARDLRDLRRAKAYVAALIVWHGQHTAVKR